jgi:hypothetical protein
VNNSPVNYTNPSGHICVHNQDSNDEVAMAGNCGGGENPHYDGGLLGPGWNNDDGDEEDANASGSCGQNDYECLLRREVDQEFDPYLFLNADNVDTSSAIYYNGLAFDAYRIKGYNLEMIAALGINNPMTVSDFATSGVPIEWIEIMNPRRRTPATAFFLQEMRLNPENVTNYETNYLVAMMEANPDALFQAKENYYNALIDVTGSVQNAYELFLLSDELYGTEINE